MTRGAFSRQIFPLFQGKGKREAKARQSARTARRVGRESGESGESQRDVVRGCGGSDEDEASTFFPRTRATPEDEAGGDEVASTMAGEIKARDFDDYFKERRTASSAPQPFFRSPKWTNPEAYLASTRSTAPTSRSAGGLARPPRFPLSRLVLWDRTSAGDALVVNPTDFVPRLNFSETAIESIFDQVRRGTPAFVIQGSLDGSGVDQRLSLESEASTTGYADEETSLAAYASVSGAKKTANVNFVCHDTEDDMREERIPGDLRSMLLEEMRGSLDRLQGFGAGAIVPSCVRCCTTKGSKSKELMLRGNILLPSQRLKLRPIFPLLTCNTTLSQSLFATLKRGAGGPLAPSQDENRIGGSGSAEGKGVHPVSLRKAARTERTGFLTMDQGHRLLPLLENEPLAKDMPLLGVWVACGATGSRSVLVYAACLRFLFSDAAVRERVLQREHFLLLLFSAGAGAPQCFECSLCPSEYQDIEAGEEGNLQSFQSANLPHCLEYAFETRVRYEEAGAGKAVQLAGLEAVRRQPAVAMEDGRGEGLRAEGGSLGLGDGGEAGDLIPEEPRPLAPTPSAALSRGRIDLEDLSFDLPPPSETVSGREPEPVVGPGYWTLLGHSSGVGPGGVSSVGAKVKESAALATISQQQQQLRDLQAQMTELQRQLKDHVSTTKERPESQSSENPPQEPTEGSPKEAEAPAEDEAEAEAEEASAAPGAVDAGTEVGRVGTQVRDILSGLAMEAERSPKEDEEEVPEGGGDAEEEDEDEETAMAPPLTLSPALRPPADTLTYTKVRYTPLSDEESESEE